MSTEFAKSKQVCVNDAATVITCNHM